MTVNQLYEFLGKLIDIGSGNAQIYMDEENIRIKGWDSAEPAKRTKEKNAKEKGIKKRARKRTMSAEARKKISEAQKARWKKQRASEK